MFFRKKSISQTETEKLVAVIQKTKAKLDQQQRVVEHSVEPSQEILVQVSLLKAKYLFLLKEARHRRVNGYNKAR
ncbi:YaaL family protein [Alteribacillus sp. HJP-4]|uniref:YaaL family protein n=1 Tax=Alteribacillus sp. HJP-4 TaxID=2775394 RepID=UPI0035CD0B6B